MFPTAAATIELDPAGTKSLVMSAKVNQVLELILTIEGTSQKRSKEKDKDGNEVDATEVTKAVTLAGTRQYTQKMQ